MRDQDSDRPGVREDPEGVVRTTGEKWDFRGVSGDVGWRSALIIYVNCRGTKLFFYQVKFLEI